MFSYKTSLHYFFTTFRLCSSIKFSIVIFRLYLTTVQNFAKNGIFTGVKMKTQDYTITSSNNENNAGITLESKSNTKRTAKGI